MIRDSTAIFAYVFGDCDNFFGKIFSSCGISNIRGFEERFRYLVNNKPVGVSFCFFFTFIAFNIFFFKIQNFKILKKVIILIFTIKFKIFTQLDFDFLKKKWIINI